MENGLILYDHVEEISPLFDIYGDYNWQHEAQNISLRIYDLGDGNIPVYDVPYIINKPESAHSDLIQPSVLRINKFLYYASHIPHFAWQSANAIKRTFDTTT